MRDVDDRVLVELHRASALADRAGIVVVSRDAERADRVTGSRARTHQSLHRLAAAGRTLRVRRDLLVLLGETGVARASPLELVDAIAPVDYLVTGGRALQVHDLTDQHFFMTTVLVADAATAFEWRGERVRFHRVARDRLWGGRRIAAVKGRPRPMVATPERAILDALAHPGYGVTLGQVAGALRIACAHDERLPQRLADAARRYGSASVSRRLGLLIEAVAGESAAAPLRELIGASPTAVLLQIRGARSGLVDSRWRVRVNTDLDNVLETESAA